MSAVGRGIVLRQLDRLFGEGTLTGLGDGQLLERYLTRRDEDAFEALVDLHGPMVLGLCRRMLRDPRDIEDAFQATFLVLVRKAPAIRDRNLLSNWLYGVAFRVARRARTRTLRRRDRETTVGDAGWSRRGRRLPDRLEVDPMLDQELSRLPEKYRVPLILCYLRGQTHDQAAAELRCPVGTVRSRLARGRDLLRKRLTRRGFAPTAMAALLGGDPTLAGPTPRRDRPAAAGRRDGPGGPRVRLVLRSSRPAPRVAGPRPRSAHDHETRTIQVDRTGHPGHQPLGWRRRRGGLCRVVQTQRRRVAESSAGAAHSTPAGEGDSPASPTTEERLKCWKTSLTGSRPTPHASEPDRLTSGEASGPESANGPPSSGRPGPSHRSRPEQVRRPRTPIRSWRPN